MHLKALYVEGFKSIATPTTVDLVNDVNVIMGPNGSGKSNFFECIQWVLGGMSAKQLRASSMEDVIFDGGERGKPAEFAKGTLIFDNIDRELDVDSDEVSITRKLTRGKGTEYFVNNEPAKLKDLNKLFLNKGIGKNNYAITGQNRITEFIMMKPDEIRGVIEEAAGISGFRLKKNELVNSIANYDRDIERIDAVIHEISRSLKPLKKQIKNAEIYEVTKKELDERKLFYYSNKMDDYSQKAFDNRERFSQSEEDKELLMNEKSEIDSYLNNYQSTYEVNSSTLSDLESKKEFLEQRVSDLSKEKIMKENSVNNFIEKRDSMLSNIDMLEKSSNVEEEEKQRLLNSIMELGKSIESDKSELELLDNEITTLKNTVIELESTVSSSSTADTQTVIDIEHKEKDIEIVTERISSLNSKISEKDEELEAIVLKKQKLSNDIDINASKVADINSNIKQYNSLDSKVKALENSLKSSKKNDYRKQKALETKKLLVSVDGFKDVLFNLLSYDSKYTDAIEALHGGVLYNFVVDDTATAEKCVSILKKNKIPPANFVILSKIKLNKNANVPEIKDVELCSSVLKYSDEYTNLVNDYFGNSFIADTSQIAEASWNATSQRYRICTLEGTVYSSNVIRGGYIQKDFKKVQKEYNDLIAKRSDLLKFDGEQFANTYELNAKITVLNKDIANWKTQINNLNLDSEKIEKAKEVVLFELESSSNTLKTLTESLSGLKLNKETSLELIEESRNKLASSKEDVELRLSQRESLIIAINKNEAVLEETEKSYYVSKNNSQEKIDSLKDNVDIIQQQLDLEEVELSKVLSILTEEEGKLEDITNQWMRLRESIEQERETRDTNSDRLNEVVLKISEIDNIVTKLEFEFEKISEGIDTCKMGLSDIPEDTNSVDFTEPMNEISSLITKLEKKIKSLGFINTDAIVEYKELNERYETMSTNKADLEDSKGKISEILQTMQDDMIVKFMDCYNCLKDDFSKIFTQLFNGGCAELALEDIDSPLESGVIIKATPPGKKNKPISLLSGGEKSLAAVSFIFALLKYNPSPLVVFDEIDAALDEINVALLAEYINSNRNVQYVIVSHRTPMMKIANALYGASMNMSTGITELLSQKLNK